MLIVNDLEKLSKYGFVKKHFNIYEYLLWEDSFNSVSILVNSLDNNTQNVLSLYSEINGDLIDKVVDLDIIYDMIKDGVVSKI